MEEKELHSWKGDLEDYINELSALAEGAAQWEKFDVAAKAELLRARERLQRTFSELLKVFDEVQFLILRETGYSSLWTRFTPLLSSEVQERFRHKPRHILLINRPRSPEKGGTTTRIRSLCGPLSKLRKRLRSRAILGKTLNLCIHPPTAAGLPVLSKRDAGFRRTLAFRWPVRV